ncbi:single-stranded DNA-binding protein [Arcanobacterium urinimassiliense]|uniref:single-stranded DNA-binding protein n=1 Tax=Arcanobacterium urinimassiliense TaxID=1871014 RepID=UPI00093AC91C|nr:single-stranded DNA-binding protein [Arcanobacterium urinimassiliense]
MANDTSITVRGWAGAKPTLYINSQTQGKKISKISTTVLNVGVTPRNYNRQTGDFQDGDTTWYSVRCYGALARNVAISIQKGTPVLVRGKLTTRSYQDKTGADRQAQVIIADSLAIDLNYGVANYVKARGEEISGVEISELGAADFSTASNAVAAGVPAGEKSGNEKPGNEKPGNERPVKKVNGKKQKISGNIELSAPAKNKNTFLENIAAAAAKSESLQAV